MTKIDTLLKELAGRWGLTPAHLTDIENKMREYAQAVIMDDEVANEFKEKLKEKIGSEEKEVKVSASTTV